VLLKVETPKYPTGDGVFKEHCAPLARRDAGSYNAIESEVLFHEVVDAAGRAIGVLIPDGGAGAAVAGISDAGHDREF
jgi:hypothetical protein